MDEKYIQDLFDQLGGEDKFGPYNDFKSLISSDEKYQRDFFDVIGEDVLGPFGDFQTLVKKKDQPLSFTGQVDLSQPISNPQQGSSEPLVTSIPKQEDPLSLPGQLDFSKPIEVPLMANGLTEQQDKQQTLDKLNARLDNQNYKQFMEDDANGNYGLKNPFIKDLKVPRVMLAKDADKNARKVVGEFQEEITGQRENQGFVGEIAADASQIAPSFNKAFIGAVTSIPKAVGILAKKLDDLTGVDNGPIENYSTYQLGQWLDKKALEIGFTAIDEKRAGFLNSSVPSAFGSMLGMIMTGGPMGAEAGLVKQSVGREIAGTLTSPMAISGALQAAVPEYEAAKAAGKSDSEAFSVFLKNIPGGLTEVIPVANMFARLNKITGNGIVGRIKSAAAQGLSQGLEESSQEAVQQYLSNKIAQGSYDPKRDLKSGMLEGAGAGFVVGFVMPGVMSAMQNMSTEDRYETKKILDEYLKSQANETKVEPVGKGPSEPLPENIQKESVQVQAEVKKGEEKLNEPTGEAVKEEVRKPVQPVKEEPAKPAVEEPVKPSESEPVSQEVIKDENGNPTPFYHGTNRKDITELEPSTAVQFGKGIYFGSNKEADAIQDFADGGKIFEVNLPKNLLDAGSREYSEIQNQVEEETGIDIANDKFPMEKVNDEVKKRGYKGLIMDNDQYGGKEAMIFDKKDIVYVTPSESGSSDVKAKVKVKQLRPLNELESELDDLKSKREQWLKQKKDKYDPDAFADLEKQIADWEQAVSDSKKGNTSKEEIELETQNTQEQFVPKDGWEKNLIKSREYAQALGIDFKGKELGEIVSDIKFEQAKGFLERSISKSTPEELESAKNGVGLLAAKFANRYTTPDKNKALYDKIYNLYFDAIKGNDKPTIKEIADASEGRVVIAKMPASNSDQGVVQLGNPPQNYVASFGKDNKFKTIGKNENWDLVGEDSNGVRATLTGKGIIRTQPVSMVPTESGMQMQVNTPEGDYLTTDEGAKQKPAKKEEPSLVTDQLVNDYFDFRRKNSNDALGEAAKKNGINIENLSSKQQNELIKGITKRFIEGDLPTKKWPKEERLIDDVLPGVEVKIKPIDPKVKRLSKEESLKEILSQDDLRPAMQGIYYDKSAKKIVATNGWSLVTIGEDNISETRGEDLNGRVIDEKYPDYKSVIPKDNPISIENVDVYEWLSLAEGAEKAAGFFRDDLYSKNSGYKQGGNYIKLRISAEGTDIFFNPVLLKRVLKVFSANGVDKINVSYSKPNRGALLEGGGNITAIAMPVSSTKDYDVPDTYVDLPTRKKSDEQGKKEAYTIAFDNGFDSPTHLLNSVKKRTGKEYATVQEVPKEVLNRVVNERNLQDLPPSSGEDAFVDNVKSLIGDGSIGKRQLEKLGEEQGITDKNVVKELTEFAIVQQARELASKDDFDGLVKLYEDQPSLNHRTNESISKQQYSTPAPIGYLMGKFVGLGTAKNALEPSAGNGMLTIAGDPKIFTVNEIDDTRLANLKKQGFGEIISQDGSKPFETGIIYDAVVTNPPFGGTNAVEFDGYKINELAQIMTIRALDVMKDNGKAAIIIGGNNKFDEAGRLTGRDRIFFNYLYRNYNVKDVIDVAGDIYRKQGASFPIRVILIDGRKATPSGAAPLETSFGEQESTFEGIKNRIDKYIQNENIQPTELVGNPTDVVRGGSTKPNTEVKPKPVDTVSQGEVPTSSEGSTGKPGTVAKPGTVRSGNARGNGTKSGSSVNSGSNINEQSTIEPIDGEGQINEQQPVEPSGVEAVPEPRARFDRKIAEGVQSGESTVNYQPVSKGKAFDLMSPAGMKQEILDAQTDLLNDVGDVDEFVRQRLGYKDNAEMYDALGAEQIDGVALAIRNIERGTGIIIGDQTGVGKGRQAAAIIRYANKQGLTPIFLTEKPNLFSDLYRDLIGIKYGDITPFIVNSKGEKFNGVAHPSEVDYSGKAKIIHKAPSATDKVQKDFIKRGNVPGDASLILATYSQFSSPAYLDKINFLKSVARNNIIILDEAHNASGDGNTSHLFQELLPSTKGVVYLSGTFAKRANNMPVYALKTSMREANLSTEKLISSIEGGGVALQEIISSQLAEAGEMIRRERTFKGIEVNNRVIGENDEKVKAQQLKQANQVTDVMNDIIKFQSEHVNPVVQAMDDEAAAEGERVVGREGTSMAGVDSTPYFSKVFNVINQLLYSIKAKETALFAIEELKAGRKPFIAIRSTMEAMLKDIVDRGHVKIGDAIDADFSFVLQKGLEGVMRISVKDAQGQSRKEDIPVSDLSPQGQLEYKRIKSKISNLQSGLNISPIDELVQTLNEAGYRVGEVTGRQMKLKLKGNKAILELNKKEPVNELYRKYNNGDLDVIIVNSSGSTGASAHSDSKFKDQRQRSMLVLEPELNISTLVQMLGRVNRTGQINKPKYTFISSTIPAEQRLMMMTMRKLKSLDANTTSNQKQSNNFIEVPEIFNKYGDEVVIEYLSENPEIISQLGDPLKMLSGNEVKEPEVKEGAANKVTGRVAILTTDKQAAFYSEITERYNTYINFLNDAGLNDLQVEYLPLKTKTITKKPVILGKGGRSKFGEDTYLEEVEADNLKKPMTKQEIDATMNDLGGFSNQFYQTQLTEYANKLYADISNAEDEKLRSKIEKVNNSKETEEDKKKFIAESVELSQLQKDYKINKERDTIKYLESLFKFFTPGRAIKMPKDFNETIASGLSLSDGIFLGFDINLKKNKPFVRSNVTLKFAVNDSRRLINLPSTKAPIIKNIRSDSYDLSSAHQTHIVNDWDKLEKPKARSKRYIATGNILQGLPNYKGQIVKYSTDKGFINTGILMPEYFDPKEDELNKRISVPASKAVAIILSASNGDVFSGGEVTITKKSDQKFSIRVPKPKQTGGKFYLSPYVNDLVDRERWDSVGAEMEAFTDSSRMEQLLTVLTDKFGVSFDIDAKKAESLIKEEGPEDTTPKPPDLNKIISDNTKENAKDNYEDFSGAMSTGLPVKPIGKVKKNTSDKALLEHAAKSKTPEQDLKDQLKIGIEEVDNRMDAARKPAPKNFESDFGESLKNIKKQFTQHFEKLNAREWPREANLLRVFQTLYNGIKTKTKDYINSVVDGLTANQYKVLEMRIILADLNESIEKGLDMKGPDGKFPFGFETQEQIQKALYKYDGYMNADPKILKAYSRRESFMEGFKANLIDVGLLTETDIDNYYHRRMIEYHVEGETNKSILFGKDLADKTRSFQKARKGSRGMDYSTNFIESEFKVVAEGLYELEKHKIFKEIVDPFEAKLKSIESDFEKMFSTELELVEDEFGKNSEELERYKKGKRVLKRNYINEHIPDGFMLYRLKDANVFYFAKTIKQKQIDAAISNAEEHDSQGLSEALKLVDELVSGLESSLVVGPKRRQYLLPIQVAEQLDVMAENQKTDPITQGLYKETGFWKALVLFSPTRLPRYTLNNFGSDLDRVVQIDLNILKKSWGAAKELYRYMKYNETTPLLMEAIKQDVVNSGFQISELADLNDQQWVKRLMDQDATVESIIGKKGMKELAISFTKTPGNLWQKWLDLVTPWVQLRENIFRYAAFKLLSEDYTPKGKKVVWASDPKELGGITNDMQRNAKLAREAFVDYQNLSQFASKARKGLFPFYSWFEGNNRTTLNLIKNAYSYKTQKELVKSAALRGIPFVVLRMARAFVSLVALTAAVEAWNRFAFNFFDGDEDDEKRIKAARIRGLQVIYGKNEFGMIQTYPLQGALYDFIDYFGIPIMGEDIELLINGDDKFKRILDIAKTSRNSMGNRLAQMANPFPKAGVELAQGQSWFPDITNPTPISDNWEYVFRFFTVGDEYNYLLSDKPKKESYLSRKFHNSLFREFDTEMLSYYAAKKIIGDYEGSSTGGHSEAKNPTIDAKKDAEYKYMLALRFEKYEEADQWLQKFIEKGGNVGDIHNKINSSDPFASVRKSIVKDEPVTEFYDMNMIVQNPLYSGQKGFGPDYKPQTHFGKQLTKDDLFTIREALKYYDRLKNNKVKYFQGSPLIKDMQKKYSN